MAEIDHGTFRDAAFINIVCKATHYTIILTGATASDSQINEHIFSSIDQQYHQRVIQASGRTPMGTLKYLIQHSRMVIGTDTDQPIWHCIKSPCFVHFTYKICVSFTVGTMDDHQPNFN